MNRKLDTGELERITPESFKIADKTPITVVLDNIRSLHNVGSVFRTADAFLINKIYLCGITASPPHRDIHKTALGATETVNWEYRESTLETIRDLKSNNHRVIVIEQTERSIPLNAYHPEKNDRLVIVFGNEVKGVAQEVVDAADSCIAIPQFGSKHSLNVSVSAGIVIWDIFTKLAIR